MKVNVFLHRCLSKLYRAVICVSTELLRIFEVYKNLLIANPTEREVPSVFFRGTFVDHRPTKKSDKSQHFAVDGKAHFPL
jgi:hypothetical protein